MRRGADDGGRVALERAARQVQESRRAYVDAGRIVIDHDVVKTSGRRSTAGDTDADRRAEIDHGIANADERVVADQQSRRQALESDAIENAGDETSRRLHSDSGHGASLNVRVFDKKVAGGGGMVYENAMTISGAVVALAVDVAVLDVERFTGDPANSIQARPGAVDGKVSDIDHIIRSSVDDDTADAGVQNSRERSIAVDGDGFGDGQSAETAGIQS